MTKLCVQIKFVMGPPGPKQWIYFINMQPLFRLDLFSIQSPLRMCCTALQPVYSSQQPAKPKSAVLSVAVVHVEICSLTMSFLVVDVIQVQAHPCCAPCLQCKLCIFKHKLTPSSKDAESC